MIIDHWVTLISLLRCLSVENENIELYNHDNTTALMCLSYYRGVTFTVKQILKVGMFM